MGIGGVSRLSVHLITLKQVMYDEPAAGISNPIVVGISVSCLR